MVNVLKPGDFFSKLPVPVLHNVSTQMTMSAAQGRFDE